MGEVAKGPDRTGLTEAQKKLLLWTCFVSLVATSFAFIIRGFLADAWQVEFSLSETQKGEIMGAGLWPFGLSIVIFSLFIDRVGYGKSMIFAFACHLIAVILFFFARGYATLYWASLLTGLAAGTVEAVINPAIASVFPKQKIKWLTILHAGWPGGLALNGIVLLLLGEEGLNINWRFRVFVLLIPVVAYGIMLLKTKFAASERVSAGVSYKDMLAEAGALSCLIVSYMVLLEIDRLLGRFGLDPVLQTNFFMLPSLPMTILIVAITVGYYLYTRSLGRWMYVFLLFVMVLLATTELGTDGWIKEIMKPAMGKLGLSGGWVLVYTSVIMTVLRFLIGPIMKGVGKIWSVLATPPAFLLLSSLFAAFGIFFLAGAEHWAWILLTATIYGTGQCFFWPVTLGLVSERFPKGGALTLNAVAGVGMLGVGIIGMSMLGFWQDKRIDKELLAKDKVAYERLMGDEKKSVFGDYKGLNQGKLNVMNAKTAIYKFMQGDGKGLSADDLKENAKYQTLVRVAFDHGAREKGDVKVYTHKEMLAGTTAKDMLIDADENATLGADQGLIDGIRSLGKRHAMATVAILPIVMALCYLFLIFYFKKVHGGYKAIDLAKGGSEA